MIIDEENIIGTKIEFRLHPYLEFDIDQLIRIAQEFESDYSESEIIKKRELSFNINVTDKSNINSIGIDHLLGIKLINRAESRIINILRESVSIDIAGSNFDLIKNDSIKVLKLINSINNTQKITQTELHYKYLVSEDHHLFNELYSIPRAMKIFPVAGIKDINYAVNYCYNENEEAKVKTNIDIIHKRLFLEIDIYNKFITTLGNTDVINKILNELLNRNNEILNFE